MQMNAVNSVLVVGAGVAGATTAGFLVRAGVDVHVVEVREKTTTSGSGITLQGNALRVLEQLGVWDEASASGYGFDSTGFRTAGGHIMFEFDEVKTGGDHLPAVMGMERPVLARILLDSAAAHGATFRFGVTVASIDDPDDGPLNVTFTDGTTGAYDLVIGADGTNSAVRKMIGIDTEPTPTGMGIWRVFTERPESVVRTDLCYDGPTYIAGFCPTGENSLYAYLVEDYTDRRNLSPDEKLSIMRELAAHYKGPWEDILELMVDPETINYTWFESMLLERPWNEGRVVLIGDAAHSCPPTFAQGAAMALEDAAVLCELLAENDSLDPVFARFMARRSERSKVVVDASVQLGQWLLDRTENPPIPALMGKVMGLVSQPA
jgi:2-polyprenyl-6-methoxyphenol hydroxylase-like FAD-dependent oxidoreductase